MEATTCSVATNINIIPELIQEGKSRLQRNNDLLHQLIEKGKANLEMEKRYERESAESQWQEAEKAVTEAFPWLEPFIDKTDLQERANPPAFSTNTKLFPKITNITVRIPGLAPIEIPVIFKKDKWELSDGKVFVNEIFGGSFIVLDPSTKDFISEPIWFYSSKPWRESEFDFDHISEVLATAENRGVEFDARMKCYRAALAQQQAELDGGN